VKGAPILRKGLYFSYRPAGIHVAQSPADIGETLVKAQAAMMK